MTHVNYANYCLIEKNIYVKSLFASITVNQDSQKVTSTKKYYWIKIWHFDMGKLCVDQNIFQFNGKFYRQHDGTAMKNALSSFLAEVLMRFLEIELIDNPIFPRV